MPTDTIVALSSGAPPSGVAIVRVSGAAARPLVESIFGHLPEPRRLTLSPITLGDKIVDRGLVAWFPAPHSFTGEDCAELHLHGSPAVVRSVLRALSGRPGLRLARFLALALQLTLWGAAPVADAMLDRASASAVIPLESHHQDPHPRPHGPDCALCHFIHLFAAPVASAPSLSVALLRADGEPLFIAQPFAAGPILSPLPRGPPTLS